VTSRRALLLGIGVLVALQLLTSFTAIGVLTRMSPAIEHILEENEYSIEAAEALLGTLAAAGGAPASPDARTRATAALERMRRNVTEPDEFAPLARIEADLEAALGGDTAALVSLVEAVDRLVAINRAAMREADRAAQRLGTAGAWAAVTLAVVAFLLSLVVAARLNRRLLAPLLELGGVLAAVEAGNPRRRCQPGDAAPDVRRVLERANDLLDRRVRSEGSGPTPAEAAARAALLALLDERDTPAYVVDRDGGVVAGNREGLARLAGDQGDAIRGTLASVAGDAPHPEIPMTTEPLRDAGWLCVLPANADAPANAPDARE
jgi:membrane-associated protease RseP (regulator of RpoE activity)